MDDTNYEPPQLILVTPPQIDAAFPETLEAALSAGAVAAVLIAAGGEDEARAEEAARLLVPVAQAHGAAAIVLDHTRVAGRTRADGVQVNTGLDELEAACRSFKPRQIVGAGNVLTRHAAMEAGERDIDYVAFGRVHGDTHAEAHPRMLDLAAWWSELAEVPAVVLAGHDVASVAACAATGAEFVALHRAVWEHAHGPAEAVRAAERLLGGTPREAFA